MCGIAGCYQQADGHKLTDVMINRIAHRGPDASGIWTHENERVSIHLGHLRLSIIDLSTAADQPITKHGLTIIWNGELYNYKEIRAELAGRGVSFSTTSDTEVALEAWRAWGPDALPRFRGMFAFALADEKTGELFLARDPFGIKPMFYLQRGDGALFASELKALTAAVGPELRIEPGALVASMLYYWVPEQFCAIQNVHKLPAGSWARLRPDGRIQVEQYWNVADVARDAAAGPAPDLARVIEESVTAHLVADVPVSSFLSGGLDSSIITVLAHRAAQEIDAYTITFRPEDQRLEAMPDDAIYARKVAARYGVKLHEIEISPDIVDMLPRIVDMLDEPIGDPAAINTLLMCRAARDRGVKVILIRELVSDGITLLLTTQYLEEADALADHIVLIDHGREIATGTPSELKALVGDQRVDVIAVDSQGFEQLERELSWQGLELTLQPEQRRISVPAPDEVVDLNRVATAVAATRVPIDEIALRRPTLDDAFISLTGHATEEEQTEEEVAA